MIVVAIVGILAAIAYPSYMEHIRKGNRADAEASLMQLSQFMERYFTGTGRYSQTAGQTDVPNNPAPPYPTGTNYTFTITVGNAGTSYTATATPNNPGVMANDKCGALTLTNNGLKGQTGTGVTTADCWRR
ncbi:hypothetical protein NS274_18615 [Pseudomonas oryzihabitans]|nr:hypothetical protein NS274_18615 [Pseudomonas psychrotolerans]KTT04982.1 hypothetical protein NS376_01900 [Pseudomonas psychrotolerans]KTT30132.1 hypothetical protein NS201_14260 [Pseudomonas psychrotolerans]KTT41918.1 hypothetical protein SB5_00485 [Pseudomonas psychrotolerans]KTT44582.1 hypothetical protein RSA46_11325 [Pseudomonas psychrotolerans]